MTILITLQQDSKGKWTCSGNVLGKAISFEADNAELPRYQMVDYISKLQGASLKDVKWGKPVTWDEQQKNNEAL